MFNYLVSIFGGKPIGNNYSTATHKVDKTAKGKFEYVVRVSHVGVQYDVIVKVFDLNEDVLWKCPACGKKLILPKLEKLELREMFGRTWTNHENFLIKLDYGNGHDASIKEVLEYEEK
ncbi:TPA: hypothetical protein NNQ18_004629 [Salmonella enterica]|nr:hypothetical protein [Salmonella enterica]HCH9056040.1 hypothetical protein [Salmonella enterica]